jgi:hypothetical protein
MSSDAGRERAVASAREYAAACGQLLDSADSVLQTANYAVKARNMAEQRPQHEISIKNFLGMAEEYDQRFPSQYKEFLGTCAATRSAAENFRTTAGSDDPELILLTAVDGDTYGRVVTAAHMLRTTFGPTPAGFVEGVQVANAAIQADIFAYGEEGFTGHVYSPPTSVAEERACPWCAETIKAAAIICRYCGRDVQPPSR